MGEYGREQRNQLSRAISNSETGSKQLKEIVDHRIGVLNKLAGNANFRVVSLFHSSVLDRTSIVQMKLPSKETIISWFEQFDKSKDDILDIRIGNFLDSYAKVKNMSVSEKSQIRYLIKEHYNSAQVEQEDSAAVFLQTMKEEVRRLFLQHMGGEEKGGHLTGGHLISKIKSTWQDCAFVRVDGAVGHEVWGDKGCLRGFWTNNNSEAVRKWKYSTFFPEDWDDNIFLDEIAYARSSKPKFTKSGIEIAERGTIYPVDPNYPNPEPKAPNFPKH